MQWRSQRTLAGWLSIALLMVAVPHAVPSWSSGGRVNIDHQRARPIAFVTQVNRAPWPELALLPGIGPALARRIVESRQQQGPFRRSEDLLRVRGIGPKKLAAIRAYLVYDEHPPRDQLSTK